MRQIFVSYPDGDGISSDKRMSGIFFDFEKYGKLVP